MSIKFSVFGLEDKEVESVFSLYKEKISNIFDSVVGGTAVGVEMAGWIEWINRDHSDLINSAKKLKDNWKQLGVKKVVVIGTGGSYIGCRAGLEFYKSMFNSFENDFEFIFVPYFSERYISELINYLEDKKFSILVISKSGTTLESAVAFRLLRDLLYKKEQEKYKNFVAAITDKSKGTLRNLSDKEGFVSFVIEDDIGGRYSTLTSVGLVPMILGGVDVEKVLEGARKAYKESFVGNIENNTAAKYASLRHYLFDKKNLVSECFICYDPHLRFLLEKVKQLFAESEGKNNKGIMPVLMNFTPDLHSVGQLLQDGNKSFFETTFLVDDSRYSVSVNKSLFNNDDNLDWIAGKSLKEINECAFKGTLDAHSNSGKIPNIVIKVDSWGVESFGYIYYWLSLVAMFSSYLFEVNPFDQPGVENYKKRMFDLLKTTKNC